MFVRHSFRVPVLVSLALTTAAGLMLLGGCPQPQTPQTPDQGDNNTPGTVNPPTNGTGDDRPIQPPPVDGGDDGEAPDGGGDGDGSGNGGNGGDGGTTGSLSVRFTAPLQPTANRPGTLVDLIFKLTDRAGVLTKAEFVVARDEDADGEADGDPLTAQVVDVVVGSNTIAYDTSAATSFLTNGFGRFVLGMRVTSDTGAVLTDYAPGTVTLDSVPPTAEWVSPKEDYLVNPTVWTIELKTTDNSPHTVTVYLDADTNAANGYSAFLLPATQLPAGTDVARTYTTSLSAAPGAYYYYVEVSDGIAPPYAFYAPHQSGGLARLSVTNRLVNRYELNYLVDPNYAPASKPSPGAILQGFNFNDLGGSSMAGVPDINGDGHDELLIASRFGKPGITSLPNGVGFGEAYLFYGSASRLRGISALNSAGKLLPGLAFPGIRAPVQTTWTEGLSDVTVIPDMDGDDLPELVFSFPRVESVSLSNFTPTIQSPDNFADYPGMGGLEYDAYYRGLNETDPSWHTNEAQFTRGGIVIVSSHNPMLQQAGRLNRKANRVIDLAEVGQLFAPNSHPPDTLTFWWDPEILQGETMCPDPADPNQLMQVTYEFNFLSLDIAFEGQGPGGFDNHFSRPQRFGLPDLAIPDSWKPDPNQPPLANLRESVSPFLVFVDPLNPTETMCAVGGTLVPFASADPCLGGEPYCFLCLNWIRGGGLYSRFPVELAEAEDTDPATPSPYMWNTHSWFGSYEGKWYDSYDLTQSRAFLTWTGFGGLNSPKVRCANNGDECGARILGQTRDDRFGAAVGVDGTYLYISASERMARRLGDNVPSLTADRPLSGVVYQLRTHAIPAGYNYTVTQLWMEPNVDVPIAPEDPNYPDDPNDPNTPAVHANAPFPHFDQEQPELTQPSMPVPHQYIIETKGFTRGDDRYWPDLLPWGGSRFDPPSDANWPDEGYLVDYSYSGTHCEVDFEDAEIGGVPSFAIFSSGYWPHYNAATAEYFIDRPSQIVGPHVGARIRFVRGVGDVNADGIQDFAVGSSEVRQTFTDPSNPSGPVVGGVFIVFGRPPGLEGDYLLERLILAPSNANRLHGVLLLGASANDKLGQGFDFVGDFDGDGIDDVIVGAEGSDSNRGQAIVILGSTTLESPAGGWTVDDMVAAGRAINFRGVDPNDLVGANVAGAGDVDGDGLADVLIAAPGAEGGKGAVYLIYGSPLLRGLDLSLGDVGTVDLVGAKIVGRVAGDQLGGGRVVFDELDATADRQFYLNPGGTDLDRRVEVTSRGVVRLGDIDNDGKDDYAISAMRAAPNGKTDAGEVYIMYGAGDN